MTRTRLIFVLRLCLLAAIALWFGVPWYYVGPLGLLPAVLRETVSCSACGGGSASAQYQLDASGITSSGGSKCTNCGDFNGTWVITMGASNCKGTTPVPGSFSCSNGCGTVGAPAIDRGISLQILIPLSPGGDIDSQVIVGFSSPGSLLPCRQVFDLHTAGPAFPDCTGWSSTSFPSDNGNDVCNMTSATALVTAL